VDKYCLLGNVNSSYTDFEDVDWSTDKVFDQTLVRVSRLKLKLQLLARRRDIDTIEDVRLGKLSLSP